MTFDEALAALLPLVGDRVEVHVVDVSESPQLVATFGGRLETGQPMTTDEAAEDEAIFIALTAGDETAAISLDREQFRGAVALDGSAITLKLGGVELTIARRG